MSSLEIRSVQFTNVFTQYNDLTVYTPNLPEDGQWAYLGPVATSDNVREQNGVIVKANTDDALADVVDWNPVFIDIEGGAFSTWRGVAPDEYVVIGDVFLKGIEKPTPAQTAGIKAVHKNLTANLRVQRRIWGVHIPFAVLTLWDMVATPLNLVPTGGFASTPSSESEDLEIPVLRYDA